MRTSCVILTIGLLACGCSDFGAGGTGEWTVERRRLDRVPVLSLAQVARPGPATRPAPPATAEVSIESARAAALENNLELRAQLFNPRIAEQTELAERAAFEALFTFRGDLATTDSPTASTLAGSQTELLQLRPGVRIPLISGGVIRADVPISRFDTNNPFATLNPSVETDLSLSVAQPLLRGGGIAANALGIRVAFYRRQVSLARAKLDVTRLLSDSDRAYWRLVAARQQQVVRGEQLGLARAQLERARRLAEAGAAAEIEVIRAESGVADAAEQVIAAENLRRQRERELKRILNRKDIPIDSQTELLTTSTPDPVWFEFDPQRLAAKAVENRMELLELELQLAEQTARLLAAENATLPLVSLEYTYNINGLGGSFSESLAQSRSLDFQDHRVGLNVEIPLGNQAARARLRQSILSRLQTLATRDAREQQIRLEVFNAVDQLQTAAQRILAARARVVLAQRVVELETRQFEQGLRTSTDVLDAQTRLSDARNAEIAALADYQISLVDLAFATGTTLGAADVRWDVP